MEQIKTILEENFMKYLLAYPLFKIFRIENYTIHA